MFISWFIFVAQPGSNEPSQHNTVIVRPAAIARLATKPPCPAKVKASSSNPNKTKRLWAWEHFDKFVDEDGQTKAKYKYRAKEYMFDSRIYGTSNVKSHVPTCLEYPYQELPEGEHPLSKDGEDGNLVPKNFSNVAGRKALIEMIILDEPSFRFVEG